MALLVPRNDHCDRVTKATFIEPSDTVRSAKCCTFVYIYCSRYDLERQGEIRREQDGNKTDEQDLLERLEAIISTVQ